MVEKGIFLKDNEYTHDTISRTLEGLKDTNLDVLVLSSTHLSFVRSNIISMYPSIKVIDPALNAVKRSDNF